jgi:hypothetical protein
MLLILWEVNFLLSEMLLRFRKGNSVGYYVLEFLKVNNKILVSFQAFFKPLSGPAN